VTRVGLGFDLHPFVAGRPLVLGGVTVESDRGLGGHSDADVLSHAIGEALLGAVALGDLGRHFPDTDERYRDISSLVLLRRVVELVSAHGGRLVNVDATLLAQAPRLAPLLPEMAKRLADVLGLAIDRVSVKAKSPEGLGLLGRKEGMAAGASHYLVKPFGPIDLINTLRGLLGDPPAVQSLGQYLIDEGILTHDQLAEALSLQRSLEAKGHPRRLGEVLSLMRAINTEQLQKALERQKKQQRV